MPIYRLMALTGSIPLAGRELKIGSSPDCQVRAEGPEVASHHARILVRENQPPLVVPCSASCETFIDGKAIAGQAELLPGQILRVGESEFHLELSTHAELPVAPRRPLWRRLVRWSLYAAGALLALVVLVIVLVPVILSEARVKQKIEDVLEEHLQRDVDIRSVELDLLHGLKINDLQVANREGFSADKHFLIVREIDIRAEVWPFLRSGFKRLSASVTVRDPAVYVEREATTGALNTAGMFEGADGGTGKPSSRQGDSRNGKNSSKDGPLGPIQELSFKFAVENGSMVFDDHRARSLGRLDGVAVKADVTDFSLPDLRGTLSYDLAMTSARGSHPGRVSIRGAADFDLKEAAGRNALGLDIEKLAGEKLTGEMVHVDVQDLDLADLAACFNVPTPGATSLKLVVKPVSVQPLTVSISGSVDTPRLDAVALRLGTQPMAAAGARITVDGQADLESGTARLNLEGKSPLWSALVGSLNVQELPALALAGSTGKPNPAARVTLDLRSSADIAALTGPDFGALFGAKAPIKGAFSLALKADGPVSDLPATLELAFKGLTVPQEYTDNKQLPSEDVSLTASSVVSLSPATLELRRVAASATISSAAVEGGLANGIYVAASPRGPRQLAGEVALKANFRKLLDRYSQVLPALPALDEDLTLKANAQSGKGPIVLHAEFETRQVGSRPDPIKVSFDSELEAGREWNFRKLAFAAKTPESPALDLRASGEVLNAFETPQCALQFSSPQTDLAALRARLAQIIRLGGDKLAGLDLRGQLGLSGGEIKGGADRLSTKLTLDLTGLEITGLGPDGKDTVRDSKIRLDLNADVEMQKHSLTARTLTMSSSICNLNLSGEMRDWTRLLGEYKFSLDADAEKTAALLGALGLVDRTLAPKGKVNVALSADTRAGTITLDRFLIDTDLANVRITSPGPMKGFRVEKFLEKDPKESAKAFDDLAGELVLERCSTDLAVLSKLRGTVPAIPRELSGSGPISLTGKASGSKGRVALTLAADAGKAAVAFTGLVDKPANVAAGVALDGEVLLDAQSQAFKIGRLEARLGELLVSGSGASALDMTAVQVKLDVPEFAPESIRTMFPPLADFTFGGKVECTGLSLSGNLKEVLDSKEDVFSGRLARLSFGGKVRLADLSFECRELPHMKLRADGSVTVDTNSVRLEGLSAGVVHKRTQQETRLTVVKGLVTSAVKDGRLLTDLRRLGVEKLEVVCPEAKVHEVLLAIEAPTQAGKPPTGAPKTPPAGAGAGAGTGAPGAARPPAAAGKTAPAAAKPYEFLAGYVVKDSRVKVGRVCYLNYVLTDLAGSLALKDNVARVYDFKAKAYKGDVAGRVTADLNVAGIAHSAEIMPTGVDVDSAATEIMAYKDIFHGKASGTIAWTGVGFKPGEFSALDGKVQIKYEDGLVRNIEKFPPLREAVKAFGGDLFLPELLKAINATEFKFVPAELTLNLEAVDGKPVIRARDKAMLRTVEADPLEMGLLGGVWLFPDAKGEFPFVDKTSMYIHRVPGKWLDKLNVEGLLPKQARTDKAVKALRGAVADSIKGGNVHAGFRGTVQNPDVDKAGFAKDIVKMVPSIVGNAGVDVGLEWLKNQIDGKDDKKDTKKDGKDKKKDDSNPLEDLLKKKLKL